MVKKPKLKGKAEPEPPQLPKPAVVEELKPPGSEELEHERTRSQEIFDQVSSQLKLDPAQSSRLLQSWIHSE